MNMDALFSILLAVCIGAAIWVLHGPIAGIPALGVSILCAVVGEILFSL